MGGWLEKWRIKQSSNFKLRLKLKLELGNIDLIKGPKLGGGGGVSGGSAKSPNFTILF